MDQLVSYYKRIICIRWNINCLINMCDQGGEKINLRKMAVSVLGIVLCMMMSAGIASAFLIDLMIPNATGAPVMTYATVYGSVDGADNSIFHFEVDLVTGLSSTLTGGSNFGMDKFFFNTNLTLTNSMFDNIDPSEWGIKYEKQAAGFGLFSLELKDTGNRSDHIYFDIDFTSAVSESNFYVLAEDPAGNGHFAAHIGGFNYGPDNIQSVFVRNEVPEMQAIYLLGIGIIGLFGLKRRFREDT